MDRATFADYLSVRQALLPTGGAWPREPEATLTRVLSAEAEEDARLHNRALDLVEESDPRTTVQMIADWERVCGLPDACSAAFATTLDERRAAVVARLTSRGGQSRAFYIALAASLGYEATIEEFFPFTCESECEDPIYGPEWHFTWRVRAPEETIRELTCETPCEEPLRKWGNELLECAIARAKPAHTNVLFGYGE